MPLVKSLLDYISEKNVRFHMPGHKGGKGFSPEFLKNLAGMDITEIPGSDNLHYPEGAIAEAQHLAARAFGADRSYFLVNGSTCGIHAMIMAACPPGSKLLVPRNCHKSVWNALILGDIQPVYIQPGYDASRHIITQISPRQVEEALDSHPDAVGLILVHPNYYGMCSHIEEIARIVHSRGKLLLVDEAHGDHFPFHPDLPPSAGEAGADLWVQSAHKTLPAFTQTAYLHGREGRIDFSRVEETLRMLQSTSPSYILMASLDWARNVMEICGRQLLANLMNNLNETRNELEKLGIPSLREICWDEISALDPTRLVLDLRNINMTGYEAEKILRKHGIQIEMSDWYHAVLICTVVDTQREMDALVKVCSSIIEDTENKFSTISDKRNAINRLISDISLSISREIPKQMLSPREAFYSKTVKVPLKESMGRISAAAIGAYPPGIPRYCPGELIEAEGIDELLHIKKLGGTLFGISTTEAGDMVSVIEES